MFHPVRASQKIQLRPVSTRNELGNVKLLQSILFNSGDELLKLCIWSLLGMMNGPAGGSGAGDTLGSIFMNEKNAQSMQRTFQSIVRGCSVADARRRVLP